MRSRASQLGTPIVYAERLSESETLNDARYKSTGAKGWSDISKTYGDSGSGNEERTTDGG
jgi:hypothetical protein